VYAYNRGDLFVGLTNRNERVEVWPFSPWKDGTKVCNIFYPKDDCQTIQGGKMQLVLLNGEVKIFLPDYSSFFKDES